MKRPLDDQKPDTFRGKEAIIGPDCSSDDVIQYDPVLSAGELMGIVLSVEVVGEPLDCPKPRGFRNVLPSVRAELDWALGCNRFKAVCDVQHGTVIGLVAENVRITARYHLSRGPGDEDCSPRDLPCFKVRAGAGYVARAHNSNSARLTERLCLRSPGDRQIIPIPPFAISMTVLPADDGKASVVVMGLFETPQVRYVVGSPLSNVGQHNVENALPLFNGARFVEVENINGDDEPLDGFVVFGLSL